MKKIFFGIVIVISLIGCSQKKLDISDVEKELEVKNKTLIYDIKMQDITQSLESSMSKFSKFPFISETVSNDFNGHYSPEFYEENPVTLSSQRMDKVDYWVLQRDFKSLDIIYTKSIWINQYKQVSDDIFVNLCYAHKLSPNQQKVLLEWIRQGGILWVENGLYATGDEFNLVKIKSQNLKFLDFKVSQYTFENSKQVVFENVKSIRELQKIKSLQLTLQKKKQINYILKGTNLLSSSDKILLSLNKYGKGKIVSLLPFEFTSLYRDGELLRWKVLGMLKSDEKFIGLKIPKAPKIKLANFETELKKSISKSSVSKSPLKEGFCIQLFSTHFYKSALEEIKYSVNFPLSRIDKRGKQFVGRIGMYQYIQEGERDLIRLKKIYPNAYMRRCEYSK